MATNTSALSYFARNSIACIRCHILCVQSLGLSPLSLEQYALSAGSGWREGVFDKLLLDGSGNTFYDQTGGSRTNSLVDEDHAFRTENYEDEEEDEERHATLLKYATPNRR